MSMEEWKEYRLGDVCDISIGRTPPRAESVWFNPQVDFYNWISIKDMGVCGKHISSTAETISKEGQKRFNIPLVLPDTVILSFKLTVGRVAITSNKIMLTNEAIAQLPIIDKKLIDKDFLYYYLKNFNYRKLGSTSSIATAVNSKMVKDITILCPAFQIQQKIASILSSLDDKIECNRRINENLEQQAQALFKSWFVDFEPFRDGEFVESELGMIPKGWKVGTLDEICNFENGFAFKSETYTNIGDYKIITIKNVQDGYLDTSGANNVAVIPNRMPAYCNLNIGDILLSLTGNVGRCCFVTEDNLLLNQRVAKIKPTMMTHCGYVYTLFRMSDFKERMISIARGTAQANLSPVETSKLQIIIPSENILEKFSMIANEYYRKMITNMIESRRLTELRDTLLPRLMSGELKVSDVTL